MMIRIPSSCPPRAANFDESKVDPNLRLPDPLLLRSGRQVTSAAAWWKYRRPEIVAAFDTEIYGRVPKNVPAVACADCISLLGQASLTKFDMQSVRAQGVDFLLLAPR